MEQQSSDSHYQASQAFLLTTDVNRLLASSGGLLERMEQVTSRICQAFGVDACVIRRLDADCLRLVASSGLPETCHFPCMPANYGISRLLVENWRSVSVEDADNHPVLGPLLATKKGFLFQSYSGIPLIAGGRLQGILGIFTTTSKRAFSPFEIETLEATGYAVAMALQAETDSDEYASLAHDHSRFPVLPEEKSPDVRPDRLIVSRAASLHPDYRYRSLVELTSDWIWETDTNNRYTFISPQIERILGYRPEEILGTDPHDWTLPKDRARADVFRERLIDARGRFSRAVLRHITKDGRTVYIEMSGLPIFDSHGNWLGYRGVNRDITEQHLLQKQQRANARALKQQNESLFAALERYELASRDTQSGIWDWHLDPETLEPVTPPYRSPHLKAILGFVGAYEDAVPEDLSDLTHPDDLQCAKAAMAAFLRGESREYELVFRMRHRDGSWRSLVSRATALRNEKGVATRVIGIYADVTERTRQEEELRHSQQFISQIANNTPDIIFLYDLIADCNVYSNRSIATVMGYTPEEILAGGSGFIPSLVHPDDIGWVVEKSQGRDAIPEGKFLEMEYRIRHKDGSWRWLLTRETIFSRTAAGIPHQILGIAQDITERKRLEASLAEHARRQESIATAIQHALLACAPPQADSRLEVETLYEPARNETLISGDILDYFPLTSDRYALVVGDIMGKGLEAALDMAQLKFALRAYLTDEPNPVAAMQRLNQYLLHLHQSNSLAQKDCFVGMSIAVVNSVTGELRVAVAGMNPPIILRERNGSVKSAVVATGGSPLGLLPEWEPDGPTERLLEPGDVLTLYSDGFTEAHNFCDGTEFEVFGSQRFRDSLTLAYQQCHGSLFDVSANLIETVRDFGKGCLTDDICLLLARRR